MKLNLKIIGIASIICIINFSACENREAEEHNRLLLEQINLMKAEAEAAKAEAEAVKAEAEAMKAEAAKKVILEKEKRQQDLVDQCLEGLRKFKVATSVGVNYNDFSKIVKEVKLIIDPLISKIESETYRKSVENLKRGYEDSFDLWTANNSSHERRTQDYINKIRLSGGYMSEVSKVNMKYEIQKAKIEDDSKLSEKWTLLSDNFSKLEDMLNQR